MLVKVKKQTKTVEVEESTVELTRTEMLELLAEVTTKLVNSRFDDNGMGIPSDCIEEAVDALEICAELSTRFTHRVFDETNDKKGE